MSRNNGSRAGTYYRPQPIDFVLLEKMPQVGTIGGLHWKGRRVADLRQELLDEGADAELVTMELVGARIRSMHVEGLVRNFSAVKATIWARTPKGDEHLANRDKVMADHGIEE